MNPPQSCTHASRPRFPVPLLRPYNDRDPLPSLQAHLIVPCSRIHRLVLGGRDNRAARCCLAKCGCVGPHVNMPRTSRLSLTPPTARSVRPSIVSFLHMMPECRCPPLPHANKMLRAGLDSNPPAPNVMFFGSSVQRSCARLIVCLTSVATAAADAASRQPRPQSLCARSVSATSAR